MRSAHVVVVGAGIAGLATACALAKRGVRVTVLDKQHPASESSGRNMGAIGALGKHAADIAAASIEKWEGLGAELGVDIEYAKVGRLCPAHEPADVPVVEEMCRLASKQGVRIELLRGDDVARRFPWLARPALAAAYSPDDANILPQAVMRGYVALAERLGVVLRNDCLVTNLERRAGRVVGVASESGPHEGDAVLVAGGVWTYRLLHRAGVHVPVQFVSSHIAETAPHASVLPVFLRGPDYCARQLRSGAIWIGGGYRKLGATHYLRFHDFRDLRLWWPRLVVSRREVTFSISSELLKLELVGALRPSHVAPRSFEPRTTQKNIEPKWRGLLTALPQLASTRIVRRWGGVHDLTPDALPILGPIESRPGLYVATGFNGQGFSLGPVVGDLLSASILGERPAIALEPYAATRFARADLPVPSRIN